MTARERITIRRRRDPEAVASILRTLPAWFGVEEATANYIESAGRLESYLAVAETTAEDGSGAAEDTIGVALVERHFPESAELSLLAVRKSHRGAGTGRALVEHVAHTLQAERVSLLQVHTVGPSSDDGPYAETREFYRRVGFLPLQEFDRLEWDGPTLILVRPLGT